MTVTTQPADPTIDEIRAVRHAISEECGHDPYRLVEYLQRFQEQFRDRLLETADRPKPEDLSAA